MASTLGPRTHELRKAYNDQAGGYNTLLSIPFGVLEAQLVGNALGRLDFCKGAVVLDLGGGTGMRAVQAVQMGASAVDIVDISSKMMTVGKEYAANTLGPDEAAAKLRWLPGDASKPLYEHENMENGGGGDKQAPLLDIGEPGRYDIVMANWLFDHVGDIGALEVMFQNINAALRSGGGFIAVRACDPRTPAMTTGKYGPTCRDFKEFPGGVLYNSIIPASPPIHLENASLHVSYSGSVEMYHKYGLGEVKIEPPEMTDVVRQDPEYWKLWLEQPGFAVVTAKKI